MLLKRNLWQRLSLDLVSISKPSFSMFFSKERVAKLVIGCNIFSDVSKQLWRTTTINTSIYERILHWIWAEAQTLESESIENGIDDFFRGFSKRGEEIVLDDLMKKDLLPQLGRGVKDKFLLFQFNLQKSILHTALGNLSKAKDAIKAANRVAMMKPNKTGLEIFPRHEAAIKLQQGIILMKESHFNDAIRPLSEAETIFMRLGAPQALYALKLKLTCHCQDVMNEDVRSIISDFMKVVDEVISNAQSGHVLMIFEDKVQNMKREWERYPVVLKQLSDLSAKMPKLIIRRLLEIEPSLTVNIAKIAALTGRSPDQVEVTLTEMQQEGMFKGKSKGSPR